MKINQFGLKRVSFDEAKKELLAAGFLASDSPQDATKLWFRFLRKSFLNVHDDSSFINKLGNFLADEETDLATFYRSGDSLTKEIFYTVGMQLLEFEPAIDFEPKEVLAEAEKIGVPLFAGEFASEETVIEAWYLLLTSHTKNGLNYLDKLASEGYYENNPVSKPFFFNGKAQAVFDTTRLIREVVYVEAPLDTDKDGKRDLLKLEILRPTETEAGLQVATLFTASPYSQGVNGPAGEELTYDVNVPLKRKEPTKTTYAEIQYKPEPIELPAEREVSGQATHATETFSLENNHSLNDFFLARGFAVVYGAGIGTRDSDGIQTCGSVEQTTAMAAYIEWLAGNRRAFTNRTDNIEIKAWWSNKKVAMTGKSYLGTLATACATRQVEGLETIISEAAISNWYQYYRDNGLVIAPGGFPGEDADVLAIETFSKMRNAGDYLHSKNFFLDYLKEMAELQDRKMGNYNTFWDERNYLPFIKDIKCDVVMVHGLNDWNVKPRQVADLWDALKEVPVAKKLILHQGQHIYINNMPSLDFQDMMNLWLSHKLYGVENNAKELLPDIVYQKNTAPETWTALDDWAPVSEKVYYLAEKVLSETNATGSVTFNDRLPKEQYESYTKNVALWEKELKTVGPMENHRYLAKTKGLDQAIFLNGRPKVKIKVASSSDLGMLSFELIDFGPAKRLKPVPDVLVPHGLPLGRNWREDNLVEFKLGTEDECKLITRGHINLQNRENAWKVDDLKANEFVEIELSLHPTMYHLPAGRQIGLVVYGTDFGMTVRGNQDIMYTIDLAASQLILPIGE
ncbi:Xaa-Pro dipeptidyl-peptidase [Enterococcus xiangfangensis]|uniref:Xaa-Pro dipeptidyl-peptidase n=1 Tax=Enterococcus xiangfangensis TaxID=1296537 RepID=A0ABU3F8J8_9ENTE|nr:Xaa-Pro dipeptidyl-peptidase [Enterococcus xiangfangensis]MDT2758978.1 Xaa-Pro dipeptidyl-peptidase [Enterococcus xiangfangensis]